MTRLQALSDATHAAYREAMAYGDAHRAAIDRATLNRDCSAPDCPNPAVIRLDDRRLCRDCYATNDFGDDT